MIGYRTPRHEAFGWASARLDDLLNAIPARLTAAGIAVIAGLRDWTAIRGDALLHRSPNAGWPEAALSRALGIALAGPRTYGGKLQGFPFVNPEGRKKLQPRDIDAACTMLWKCWGLALGLVALLALID
jgi:adenosylcobinamide-phosphate synthase